MHTSSALSGTRQITAPPILSDGTQSDLNNANSDSGVFPAVDEGERLRRRVSRFRRAGLFEAPTHTTFVEQADCLEDLCAAYRLVHDVFVCQGYLEPQAGRLRLRPTEADPFTATFTAKIAGRVMGVMSVAPDWQGLGLPSDRVYSEQIEPLRQRGRRVAEITNLAVDESSRNKSLFLELCRCSYAHAVNIGIDDLLIAVSPGHALFFQLVLGFEPLGPKRNYSDKGIDEVQLLRLDVHAAPRHVRLADAALGDQAFLGKWFLEGNPHALMTRLSSPLARMRFLNADLLRELFVIRSDAWQDWPDTVRTAIAERWGKELYNDVFVPEAQMASKSAHPTEARCNHGLYAGVFALNSQFPQQRAGHQAA